MRIISIAVLGMIVSAHAQTARDSFRKVAEELPFIEYGEVVYNRTRQSYHDGGVVTKASNELQTVLWMEVSFAELAGLAEDADPKVRTLALLKLYGTEERRAFRIIHAHLKDKAETIPALDPFGGALPGDPVRPAPQTVSQVAASLLNMIKYPYSVESAETDAAFEAWSTKRLDNPDWIAWYDFLHSRANQGRQSIPPDTVPAMAALRRQMDGLPAPVRTWMWLGVSDEGTVSETAATPLATQAEIIQAAKDLGPDALLTFLRDGSRAGLREPKIDDPIPGRRFILAHGKDLFREEDAATLREMGCYVTAVDAKPSMASAWVREALAPEVAGKYHIETGEAVAALLDACGGAEMEFVVRWFYRDTTGDLARDQFLGAIERRKIAVWKEMAHSLVAHPRFEKLTPLTVDDVATAVNKLSGQTVIEGDLFRDGSEVKVRDRLRAYLGIRGETRQWLEAPEAFDRKKIWHARIEGDCRGLAVSPDGKCLAVGGEAGSVKILAAADGTAIGELPGKGTEIAGMEFHRSDGHLVVLDGGNRLTEWDLRIASDQLVKDKAPTRPLSEWLMATPKELSGRVLRPPVFASAAWNKGGDLLVIGPTKNTPPTERFLRIVDWERGTVRKTIPTTIDPVTVLALSPDGKRLAAFDVWSKNIWFWDTEADQPPRRLEGHAKGPYRMLFSPNNEWLLSIGDDSKVMLWDGKTGQLRHEFTSLNCRFKPIGFSSDSRSFVAGSTGMKMAIFECESGKAQCGFAVDCGLTDLAVSADGNRLFTLGSVDEDRLKGFEKQHSVVDCWDLTGTK